MNQTQTVTSPSADRAPRSLDLDAVAHMNLRELTALYRGGRVPADIAVLDGSPASRMLTVRGPLGLGPAAAGVRRFAASGVFPWAGKSFSSSAPDAGGGINRVRLGGERAWFPFATRVEPSAIDGEPCIVLDYDRPENPWFIRAVHDELREVDRGLFIGPAMWKRPSGPALLLFFACDAGSARP